MIPVERSVPAVGARHCLQQVGVAAKAEVYSAKIIGADEDHSHFGSLAGRVAILQPVEEVFYLIPCRACCS